MAIKQATLDGSELPIITVTVYNKRGESREISYIPRRKNSDDPSFA